MQTPMMTSIPPADAIAAASSLTIPSWSHSTFAPMATAWRATSGVSDGAAKDVDDVDDEVARDLQERSRRPAPPAPPSRSG